MNVYDRFAELKSMENDKEAVECHDATHGTVYKELKDLPVHLAEQPSQYAYFRWVPNNG